MKYQLVGEIIAVIERDAARIFKVLHQVGPEKEVIEVYCGKADKKGNVRKFQNIRLERSIKELFFSRIFVFL